jgi:outer membrane lipoprotein SlyB
MNALSGRFALIFAVAVGAGLSGCASGPHSTAAGSGRGVVQDVQRLAGPTTADMLGVTNGDPVAAGAPGAEVGNQPGDDRAVWRIVVRMDSGKYVSVTRRGSSGVRNGDYVELRGDEIFVR